MTLSVPASKPNPLTLVKNACLTARTELCYLDSNQKQQHRIGNFDDGCWVFPKPGATVSGDCLEKKCGLEILPKESPTTPEKVLLLWRPGKLHFNFG